MEGSTVRRMIATWVRPMHGAFGPKAVMPLLALTVALAVFLCDLASSLGIAVAVLYVIVIVMAVSFASARGLVWTGLGCIGLTLLAYGLEHGEAAPGEALLRCLISIAAIGVVTALAYRSQSATQILRESERRYRSIFQCSGVSIWEEDLSRVQQVFAALTRGGVTDLRAYMTQHPDFVSHCMSLVRIVDVNEAAITLVGARDLPHMMASLHHIFVAETAPSFREFLLAYHEGRPDFSYETVIRTIQGERLAILMRVTFPRSPDALHNVLVSVVDITDRIRAELALDQTRAELAHVARVVTLGQLTASIAHEVNQPLAAIVTNGEAGLRWLGHAPPDLAEARQCIQALVAEGRRAAQVVLRLRQLASKGSQERDRVAMKTLIDEAVGLLEREVMDKRIEVHRKISTAPPPVMGDRVQLQQVLINLLINAIQAMSESDRRVLTIRLQEDPAEGLVVSITDTGPGLSPAVQANLFTPFFTTKPNGMGMGLSICRSIIATHGGRMWAQSAAGEGATFHFSLPLAEAETAAGPLPPSAG